ncbi:hypothetical protein H2248_000840 [Termitomyces sp. 'cryptogamus']|nr:hypothetical protein H2248_000840 [Termitomyces sp. 'cryptogamus']
MWTCCVVYVVTSYSLYSTLLGLMGSLCSKPGNHTDGHHVLGSHSGPTNPAGPSPSDPRTAAAEAAERRLKTAQARGTNPSNPHHGRLAAKAGKLPKPTDPRQEERLVWD